jgi:hypothetical protein
MSAPEVASETEAIRIRLVGAGGLRLAPDRRGTNKEGSTFVRPLKPRHSTIVLGFSFRNELISSSGFRFAIERRAVHSKRIGKDTDRNRLVAQKSHRDRKLPRCDAKRPERVVVAIATWRAALCRPRQTQPELLMPPI